MEPGTLVYHTTLEPRTGAAPLVHTVMAEVVRVHNDIGWTEVLPRVRFVHVEGYPQMGRRLPLALSLDREPYQPHRIALDAFASDELRPVFTI